MELYEGDTFQTFFKCYDRVCRSIRDKDDFWRITYEALEDASGRGVRYQEMFWNPTTHMEFGVPFIDQIEGITEGIRQAEVDFGIQARLIAAIHRERSPDLSVELIQLMIKYRNEYLIGVGLDYSEETNPPERFWKAYRLAKEANFHRTAHICEIVSPPRDLETCLDLLNCERIDHGYRVILDRDLTQRCANEGVVFTVVPDICNYEIPGTIEEWTAHGLNPEECPIKTMVDLGLRVVLSSDEPAILNAGLVENYIFARERMGFSPSEFKQLVLNGIEGAWLDEATKRQWREDWTREIDTFISVLSP
jgi:adenosine deaminase